MPRQKLFSFVVAGIVSSTALFSSDVFAQPSDSALLAPFRWRNIGPSSMGGRVVDIEAVDTSFATVYVASASGGVFKSENAGTTWRPVFDHYRSASIGDIALFQKNPDIVWIGTGEANNRNSVAWGDGIYKSTDGGRSFTNVGLRSTFQIARVVTHPDNADVVYVAAIGNLWGYTGERGVFKTVDGGAKWTKLGGGLPDDGRAGATELVMDPSDPNTLYTAFYDRLRRPWTFTSGGKTGGIFKSVDGGATWTKLTAGLPAGPTGRIGLAISRSNPRVVMAIVEARETSDLARPGSGIYRSEDGGASWKYVNTYNNRPFYYSQIRINPRDDRRVYVLTTRFMVSEDGGKTFRNGSADEEIHGDFHAMWLDPANASRYYIGADKGLSFTHDHGRSFVFLDNIAIAQYYRIGVDMREPYFVYGGLQDNGTFGGPAFSRDARGILNDYTWKLHWGDGQDIQVDPTDWRRVYTEAENGSFRRYNAETRASTFARPAQANIVNYAEALGPSARGTSMFRFNWSAPLVMSPHDPATLLLGGNFLFRTSDRGESWRIISPDLSTNDSAKIRIEHGGITRESTGAETHGTITSVSQSPIDRNVIWAGTDDGNIQVTRDGGAHWTNVRAAVRGVPPGIWVDRVEASHFDPARVYVVFDGHRSDQFKPWIFRSSDYGRTWSSISGNMPSDEVVHVVREDLKNPNLLFAGTEFAVWASLDGGKRWTRLMSGMPTVATQDLVIHPRDNDLIAGTHGRSLFIVDDITPLQQLTPSVLAAPAHVFDQRPTVLWESVGRGGQRGHFWFAGENPPSVSPTGTLPRAGLKNSAIISYYIKSVPDSEPTLEIASARGQVRVVKLPRTAGVSRHKWDLFFETPPFTEAQRQAIARRFEQLIRQGGEERDAYQQAYVRFQAATTEQERRDAIQIILDAGGQLANELRGPTAGPGTYRLTLKVGSNRYTGSLVLRPDPLVDQPQ
jgi:photosystem II stability/assembly factor-like uncharacterized protein